MGLRRVNLLVDGHNLIGQLEDLSLTDPHDEAKLTMAIKSYCMRSRAKATIIFDNGMPGGFSRELSNSSVQVYFAPPRTKADTILMQRAKDMMSQNEFIMVTSDRQIVRLCYAYGIETMASEEFALMLGFRPVEVEEPDEVTGVTRRRVTIVYEKDPNPVVSVDEIAYWLPIFKRKVAESHMAKRQAEEAAREILQAQREAKKAAKAEKKGKSKPPQA